MNDVDFRSKIESFEEVWTIISKLNWNLDNDYERIKNTILESLTIEEIKNFNKNIDDIYGIVYDYIDENYELGLGDDGFSDFVYHIIGTGREEALLLTEDKDYFIKKAMNHNYVESFGYALPYDYELEDTYTIEDSKNKCKKIMLESIENYKENIQILNNSIIINKDFVKDLEELAKPILKIANDFINDSYDLKKFNYTNLLNDINNLNSKVKPIEGIFAQAKGKKNHFITSPETQLFTAAVPNMISDYMKVIERENSSKESKIKLSKKERNKLRG